MSVTWEYGELCDDTAYVDVTLARDAEQIHAHKVLDLVQHLSRQNPNKKSMRNIENREEKWWGKYLLGLARIILKVSLDSL